MTTETQTFQAPVYSAQGKQAGTRQLPEGLFDGTVNVPVMHQAVKAFLANRRQGTAKTKTRGEVTGGNQKPWKQKGTGRARQGSIRAPNWPGGGTVFGPIPRKYTQIVPKQVRALARKSALNARARENAVMLVDALNGDRAAATDWLWAGGRDSLASWGLSPDLPREEWETALPPDQVGFLRGLVSSHREGNYLFVHAGIRPGVDVVAKIDRGPV